MDVLLHSSESVCEGHPDKVCDQIADLIVDKHIEKDIEAKVACEVAMTQNNIWVLGEISSRSQVDYIQLIRNFLRKVNYHRTYNGIDYQSANIHICLQSQSQDLAYNVDKKRSIMKAGDQGIVIGYATRENEQLFPLSALISHQLTRQLATVRKSGEISWLLSDGKVIITLAYKKKEGVIIPQYIDTVLISVQHLPGVDIKILKKEIQKKVIDPILPADLRQKNTRYLINPGGNFTIGGPAADTGMTGRKIIVDTYGGWAGHGGGAFSGKDPSKIDRVAAYMARWVAKSLVQQGYLDRVSLQLAYSIGLEQPIAINVETYQSNPLFQKKILNIVENNFDFKPQNMIDQLKLQRPIYHTTSCYGHFGREEFSWEKPFNWN